MINMYVIMNEYYFSDILFLKKAFHQIKIW